MVMIYHGKQITNHASLEQENNSIFFSQLQRKLSLFNNYTIVKVEGRNSQKGGLVRGHDKPIHGSCAIYFPGSIPSSSNSPFDSPKMEITMKNLVP